MKQHDRILLLTPHLGGGGAEKVIATLARALSGGAYEVHLGLITEPAPQDSNLPAGVHLHGLGARRVRSGAWRLLQLVRRLKPRVVVAGMFHLNFLVLLLRPLFPAGTRVIVRQNGTLSASLAFDRLPPYTRLLYRLLYRRADLVICQSAAMADELAHELRISTGRLVVLPNPVDVDAIRARGTHLPSLWEGPGPHLLAVGRLAPEKGFDLLLDAFVLVRARFPAAGLVIAGAGPEEAALKTRCAQLGLNAAVCFPGHVADPAAHFPGATVFVLSSRHEGMPNALLEAAAAGLPLVATPASPGLVDLLRGHPGIWLATKPSAEALSTAMLCALDSLRFGSLSDGSATRFEHSFIEAFREERVTAAFQHLLDAVISEERH